MNPAPKKLAPSKHGGSLGAQFSKDQMKTPSLLRTFRRGGKGIHQPLGTHQQKKGN